MMNMMTGTRNRTYDHAAKPWSDPEIGVLECRVCGAPVVLVLGGAVLHAGEQVPHVTPAREDAPAVTRALQTAASALSGLPEGVSDDDRAHAIVTALYEAGALRRRPGPRPALPYAVA